MTATTAILISCMPARRRMLEEALAADGRFDLLLATDLVASGGEAVLRLAPRVAVIGPGVGRAEIGALTRRVRGTSAVTRVLALTDAPGDGLVELVEAGVAGLLAATARPADVLAAVASLAAGGDVLDADSRAAIARHLHARATARQ